LHIPNATVNIGRLLTVIIYNNRFVVRGGHEFIPNLGINEVHFGHTVPYENEMNYGHEKTTMVLYCPTGSPRVETSVPDELSYIGDDLVQFSFDSLRERYNIGYIYRKNKSDDVPVFSGFLPEGMKTGTNPRAFYIGHSGFGIYPVKVQAFYNRTLHVVSRLEPGDLKRCLLQVHLFLNEYLGTNIPEDDTKFYQMINANTVYPISNTEYPDFTRFLKNNFGDAMISCDDEKRHHPVELRACCHRVNSSDSRINSESRGNTASHIRSDFSCPHDKQCYYVKPKKTTCFRLYVAIESTGKLKLWNFPNEAIAGRMIQKIIWLSRLFQNRNTLSDANIKELCLRNPPLFYQDNVLRLALDNP